MIHAVLAAWTPPEGVPTQEDVPLYAAAAFGAFGVLLNAVLAFPERWMKIVRGGVALAARARQALRPRPITPAPEEEVA